jgi:imidazolonepropionase-like amidohydrolase
MARGFQRIEPAWRVRTSAGVVALLATALGLTISEADAIRWITLNPAWALGLDDRIGSLEVGKNADVVLWSGNPFSVYTKPDRVWIDGVTRYDRADPEGSWRTDFELGYVVPRTGGN